MTAVAAASGTRAWLAAHHMTWLTPRRLRMITVALAVAVLAFSTIQFSGSTKPQSKHATPGTVAAER
jgi:hypothetical protein